MKTTLRESTAELHEALHTHPLLMDIRSDHLTVRSYRRIIEALYGFHRPFEPELMAAAVRLGCAAEYDHEVRTNWLAEDLHSLGFSNEAIQALACFDHSFEIETIGQFAGCLYVIEGSTLGGASIVRSLAKHLNFNRSRADRFFRGYGDHTIPRWRRVCQFIETNGGPADRSSDTVDMAIQVFAAVKTWMSEVWKRSIAAGTNQYTI